MKLAELLEARRPITLQPGLDVKELAEELESRCSTFVGAYRETYPKVIYRGVTTKDDERGQAQWISIRKNRQPVQMNNWNHEALHKVFQELGLKATRANSIFCTVNKEIADDWGAANVIFVRDGWTGTVFEGKKKGYTFQELSGATTVSISSKELPQSEREAEIVKRQYEYVKEAILNLKPLSFSTKAELVDIINEGYEDILITGSSYVAFPDQWVQRGRLFAALKIGGRGARTVKARSLT